jgi:AcrR family transcriptional regulator
LDYLYTVDSVSNNKDGCLSMKRHSIETVGPRLEPDARRAHLLAVGAAVFGSKAYDEVQIDQIAQQAGVSRGLLYHYFPSKRAFFAAIVQLGYDEILEVTQPDPALPSAAQLQAGLEAYFDYVQSHPHMYRAIFRGAASSEASVQEVVNRNLDQQVQRILTGVGDFRGETSLAHLAVRAWLAFLIQAVLDWLDQGALADRQQLIAVCLGALTGAIEAARPQA